jgi:hypothetical protein
MLDGGAGPMLSVEVCGLTHAACELNRGWIESMRPFPKGCCNGQGIDSLLPPPGAFVAAPMELAMMQPADGNGELVADLPPQRSLLGKLDVMGVRRRTLNPTGL